MEILFLILKIIGICFLVFIGIVLFLILSVIFIPVRYRIRGKGDTAENLKIDFVFGWFLHLIHGRFQYNEEGVKFRLRIFGIPISLEKKPKKKKEPKGKTSSEAVETLQEVKTSQEKEVETEIIETEKKLEEKKTQEETAIIEETNSCRNHKKRYFKGIGSIKQKFKNLKQKLIRLKEQLGNIKSILSEETNRNAVVFLFQEFKYLMKHFSPRKASGEVQYGMEDPADTGQVLGIISLFPFWYRYKISVIPDFTAENVYVKGKLTMKGHIRSVHVLISGIRIIKNKDIRKVINQIRK